jgi:hypothetical protein
MRATIQSPRIALQRSFVGIVAHDRLWPMIACSQLTKAVQNYPPPFLPPQCKEINSRTMTCLPMLCCISGVVNVGGFQFRDRLTYRSRASESLKCVQITATVAGSTLVENVVRLRSSLGGLVLRRHDPSFEHPVLRGHGAQTVSDIRAQRVLVEAKHVDILVRRLITRILGWCAVRHEGERPCA